MLIKNFKKFRSALGVIVLFGATLVLFTNCSNDSFVLGDVSLHDDPLIGYAWYLQNTGQKVFASTAGLAGNDLNLQQTWTAGIYGLGIQIRISDDGLEDTHEDLQDNFNYSNVSKDYSHAYPYTAASAPPFSADDNHGTSVSGLAAAVGWNHVGSRGVAPKASLSVANFMSSGAAQTDANMVDQASGDFDISNMSWGTTQNTLLAPYSLYETQLYNAVTIKRSAKGQIFVKAAGNDFLVACNGTDPSHPTYCIGNSNFDPEDVNPYTILVTALNSTGVASSYASVGSNVWVSSFGGEFGGEAGDGDSAAMVTTDLTGCSRGEAASSVTTSVPFQRGFSGNSNCNYTVTFNGTSSASPTAAGSIALLLEANPNLTWRDVKYILAQSSTPMDFETTTGIGHPLGNAVPAGYVWEQPWIINHAGYTFHNWYGFGRINVDAAVALAKNYASPLGAYAESAWVNSATLSSAIPDNSATGVSNSITFPTSMTVEGVQLHLAVTHADISELAIELTSPSGTKSILVNMLNSLTGIANYTTAEVFLSNAFFQENAAGTWTIRVIDGKSGNTGTLTSWGLRVVGGTH